MTFGLGVDPNVKAILSAVTHCYLKIINDKFISYITKDFKKI